MKREDPIGAGKSSFDLVEVERVWAALGLAPGKMFVDLACGWGAYTVPAASRLAPGGIAVGVDLWRAGVASLRQRARNAGLDNVLGVVADLARPLPLASSSMDCCLLATALHDLVQAGSDATTLAEAARVLRPGGILVVVEFKKRPGPPGPPLAIRLAPAEVEKMALRHGFQRRGQEDVGEEVYLLQLVKAGPGGPGLQQAVRDKLEDKNELG